MKENITVLNDGELDGIVGGAFNQEIINKYSLKIYTEAPHLHEQHLHVTAYFTPLTDMPIVAVPSDKLLKGVINDGRMVRLFVEDTSGKKVELSKEEIASLVL